MTCLLRIEGGLRVILRFPLWVLLSLLGSSKQEALQWL